MSYKKRSPYCQITSLNPEVTGSCHLVTINYPDGRKTNFIVDCGMFQEKEYNELNHKKFPFNEEKIDFALVTHNHADHMGRLPYLVGLGFGGKIYASSETAKLMQISLEDSFRIEKENAQKQKRSPMYDENNLAETMSRIILCEFNEVEYVDRNIKVTFFMNGHLLGAAIILVQVSYPGEKDINLLFTGDYKTQNVFFDVKEMPEWVFELPITIISESTYGCTDTKDVSYHMEKDLETAIRSGKTLLITVFAQERAQQVMLLLKEMQRSNRISDKIPIRLDGNLAQEYTRMYSKSKIIIEAGKEDFFPENFSFISKENRNEVLQSHSQQIILTTSGMADHGPAQLYLEKWIERRNVLIYIPGYTASDTLGRKLQDTVNDQITINGKVLKKKAEVLTTAECSSHAKADEIIDFLLKFKCLNLVLINHGQKDVMNKFGERIQTETNAKKVGILGEYTYRLSCYGYMKHMGAKLIFQDNAKIQKKGKKKRESTKYKKIFVRRNHIR